MLLQAMSVFFIVQQRSRYMLPYSGEQPLLAYLILRPCLIKRRREKNHATFGVQGTEIVHARRECKYRINDVKTMYRSTDLCPRMKFPSFIRLLYDTSLGRCVLTSDTTGEYSYIYSSTGSESDRSVTYRPRGVSYNGCMIQWSTFGDTSVRGELIDSISNIFTNALHYITLHYMQIVDPIMVGFRVCGMSSNFVEFCFDLLVR